MGKQNYFIAVDSETSSIDPLTTQVLSIGAVVIDPQKLEIIPHSEFYTLVKPEEPDKVEKAALDVNKLKMEDLLQAPSEKAAFSSFADFCKKYKTGNTHWNLPVFVGYNHIAFDNVIFNRLANKYKYIDKDGQQFIWNRREQIDMLHHVYSWLSFPGKVNSISFDNIRRFLGLNPDDQAHNALSDAKDTAKIFIRWFKLYKELANRIPFEGAFNGV